MVPQLIQQQYAEAMATPNLTREEAEAKFPELLEYVRQRVPLAELIAESGITLRAASPDAPGVLIGHGCPSCGGPFGVRP